MFRKQSFISGPSKGDSGTTGDGLHIPDLRIPKVRPSLLITADAAKSSFMYGVLERESIPIVIPKRIFS